MTPQIALGLLIVSAPMARGLAAEMAPLEAYGNLPSISQMTLSPSGDRIAYRKIEGDYDVVIVQDLKTGEFVGGANVAKVKPRHMLFADDNNIILLVSMTSHRRFGMLAFENSTAFVLDVRTNRLRQLLVKLRNLFPAQSGLGHIVGQSTDGKIVYMPAFVGGRSNRKPPYNLIRVELDRKIEKSIVRGTTDTIDWFVDATGRPLIQEEYINKENVHRIWARNEDERRLIYEEETDRPQIGVVGLTPKRDALIFTSWPDDSDFRSYFEMRIADGAIDGPIFARDDASVESVVTDINRVAYGVRYSGFLPRYEFTDKELTARVKRAQAKFGHTSAYLVGWTPGFGKLLFRISGGWNSGAYAIVNGNSPKPIIVANLRPEIPPKLVVPTTIIEYEARDGVTIPALLTASKDVIESGPSPLIVLPHGGPESYDQIGFDWLAQFLASRGNAVLQPQFRGSSGFGSKLTELGRGEWGRKMSTDLDDGVTKLVADGIADPNRVCIIGGSYGGYAALAAGAFSTFAYKCIVSIAGVSDLPGILSEARRDYGKDHWVLDYWKDQFGSKDAERTALNAISPVKNAESFRAPVLLLHGNDDTVVSIGQSTAMHRALRRARKDSTLVRLRGEDHYLSKGETRLEALTAIAEFIEEHL